MNEKQAFVYLKSMVEMSKINQEVNPDNSIYDETMPMIDAIDVILRKLNKLETENAVLKSQKILQD
jgi:hypothetical protein